MDVQDRQTLAALKRLLAERMRLNEVVLFGSRARGDAAEDSDMDVLVILDEPVSEDKQNAVFDCAWEAGFDAGIVIVPVVVSHDDWESGPLRTSLLARAIREEGVGV